MGKRKVATDITRGMDGSIIVRYHETNVVKVDKDRNITLDHGEWMTPTTKSRMNEAAVDFNLGYRVYQEKGNWFVRILGGKSTIAFNTSSITFKV